MTYLSSGISEQSWHSAALVTLTAVAVVRPSLFFCYGNWILSSVLCTYSFKKGPLVRISSVWKCVGSPKRWEPLLAFSSLPGADGVSELACPSAPTFLGDHVLFQVAFLLAPALRFFPGTWPTLEAGLTPPRQPPKPRPGPGSLPSQAWLCLEMEEVILKRRREEGSCLPYEREISCGEWADENRPNLVTELRTHPVQGLTWKN